MIAEFVLLVPRDESRGEAGFRIEAPKPSDDDTWFAAGDVDVFALTGNQVGYEIRLSEEFDAIVAEEVAADEADVASEYADLAEAVWVQTQGVLATRLAESARFAIRVGDKLRVELTSVPAGGRPHVAPSDG